MADWITTKQAADMSGYSPYHIRELIAGGRIKAQKFGEVWQVSRKGLLAYLHQAEKMGKKRGPKRRLTME